MVKILVLGMMLFACTAVLGQAQPQSTPDRQQEIRRQQHEAEERRRVQQSVSRLRALSDQSSRGRPPGPAAIANIGGIYREPTKKELKKITPDAADLQKFANFLRSRRTGIVKLESYSGCGDSTRVISASEDCLKYSIPGGGSDYSFRKNNYRLARLADLRYGQGVFSSPGVLQQAVFVGLGDVPLESVGTATPGTSYIADLAPPKQLSIAVSFGENLSRGIEKDGFYYASEIRAVEGITYVLRSIAYEGKVFRSIGGVVFNEIDLDDRADIIVAFRIIRVHETGAVTILWKELDKKEAPELVRDKPSAREPVRSPFVAKEH